MSLWQRILAGLSRGQGAAGEASCGAETGYAWRGG